MDRIASSGMAALCLAGALPAWAQTHALDGAVTFSDPQVTAAAIDPNGPAPGVTRTVRPWANLANDLCFAPEYCQHERIDAGPDDPATLPQQSSLGYRDSWTTAEMRDGYTALAAHLAFLPGATRNTMSSDISYQVHNFDVAPNTVATFTVRLHGILGAADAGYPYLGRVFGETQFFPATLNQWQHTYFSLPLTTEEQPFDQTITATLRNDTPEVEGVLWYWHSGLDLQLPLPVPEPAAWLTLLAGLALLLPKAGHMPKSISLQKKM